jgi:hypothetical protein
MITGIIIAIIMLVFSFLNAEIFPKLKDKNRVYNTEKESLL